MRWVIRGGGETREVEVERQGERFEVEMSGRRLPVDLIRLDGAIASLRFPEDGRSYQITYQQSGNGEWRVSVGQREFDLSVLTPAEATELARVDRDAGPSRLTAPIPGKVVAVKVSPGDQVSPGQPLVVLEAMKMENELSAEQSGRVVVVHVSDGATVESGQLLVELE